MTLTNFVIGIIVWPNMSDGSWYGLRGMDLEKVGLSRRFVDTFSDFEMIWYVYRWPFFPKVSAVSIATELRLVG